MILMDWWLQAPERVSPKVPLLIKAILVPWFIIGFAIALIPDLQLMPDLVRAILGLPVAIGILWMALGMFLSIGDKLAALASFVARRIWGAR